MLLPSRCSAYRRPSFPGRPPGTHQSPRRRSATPARLALARGCPLRVPEFGTGNARGRRCPSSKGTAFVVPAGNTSVGVVTFGSRSTISMSALARRSRTGARHGHALQLCHASSSLSKRSGNSACRTSARKPSARTPTVTHEGDRGLRGFVVLRRVTPVAAEREASVQHQLLTPVRDSVRRRNGYRVPCQSEKNVPPHLKSSTTPHVLERPTKSWKSRKARCTGHRTGKSESR